MNLVATLLSIVTLLAPEKPQEPAVPQEADTRTWVGRKLEPVDKAAKDPSFVEFRKQLQQAVEKKDAKYLLSVLAPDVAVEVGGELGVDNFRKIWSPESPESEVWRELRDILALGGQFVKSEDRGKTLFMAPYVLTAFPKDLEIYELAVVTGRNVKVRKEPNTKSETLATLSYDIVRLEQEDAPKEESVNGEKYPWLRVELADGRRGYIFGKYLRSPMDMFLSFEKRDGKWVIVEFNAID